MINSDELRRLAEVCRTLASDATGKAAATRKAQGRRSFLLGLAQRFDRDAVEEGLVFAGHKPRVRPKSAPKPQPVMQQPRPKAGAKPAPKTKGRR
jgi:hypothetical protein